MTIKKIYKIFSILLIISIVYSGGISFATNENIKLNFSSNKKKLESGEQIEFNLNYEVLNGPESIKDGDEIKFKLPDIFTNIKPKYPPEHFKNVIVDGTTVTATFSDGAKDAVGGYISLKATVKKVEYNTTQRVEVSLNGIVKYIDIEVVLKEKKTPPKPPVLVDRKIYKKVDNPNGYSGYENGILINNIHNPVIGKKVRYSIYVNEKYSNINNAYIIDNIPKGMELIKDSIRIYESQDGQKEKDVTSKFSEQIYTNDNSIKINFGDILNKYRVTYSVIIKENMLRYDNIVNLNENNQKISSKAIVKPKEDDKMLSKYSKTNETIKDKNGKIINIVNLNDKKVKYTLDINPNNKYIENTIIEDIIPEGMKLINDSIKIGSYEISGDFNWETNKIKDKIKFENNKLTIDIGSTNKHYLVYYDLEVEQRQKSYTNKARLTYDDTSKEVENIVKYEVNAGAINARKRSDKLILQKGDSQIVNYTIDFDCYGYFEKGYLNLTDNINPEVEILSVEAPNHFSIKIDKENNTIKITNDKKAIDYGEKLKVRIKTDFSKVKEGKTISNIAKINNSITNKVEVKKGYRFIAKKVDSKTKLPLEGAIFNLLDSKNNIIDQISSDSKGLLSYSLDRPGKYYLKEIKPPKGYNLDSKEVEVNIDKDNIGKTIDLGDILNIESENILNIEKIDSENNNVVLEDAKFEIMDFNIETKAHKEYEIDNNMYLFEILEDKQLISNIVKNNPVKYEEKKEKKYFKSPKTNDKSILVYLGLGIASCIGLMINSIRKTK